MRIFLFRFLVLVALLSLGSLSSCTNATVGVPDIKTDLQRNGFARVDFPVSYGRIEEVAGAFRRFLDLPADVRSQFNVVIAPEYARGVTGYVRKGDKEGDDHKHLFHFHPKILTEKKELLKAYPVAAEFLMGANEIWQAASACVQKILQETFNGYGMAEIFGTDTPYIMLRFLSYDPKSEGVLAKAHCDAGALTLAIGESHPGLRIKKPGGGLERVDGKPGKAIFFAGINVDKLLPGEGIEGALHDVEADQNDKRWAVVAFFNSNRIPEVSWKDTHPTHKRQKS